MSFRDLVAGSRAANDAALTFSDGTSTAGDARSDTKDLAKQAVGFHAQAAGDIRIRFPDGTTATFTCAAGVSYPYRIKGIAATGTTLTAAQIVLLYSRL